MAVTGKFISLDLATLQTMQAQYIACVAAITGAHQSYSMANRTFTRANLKEVTDDLAEISYAIKFQGGTLQRQTYADMSNG